MQQLGGGDGLALGAFEFGIERPRPCRAGATGRSVRRSRSRIVWVFGVLEGEEVAGDLLEDQVFEAAQVEQAVCSACSMAAMNGAGG